MARQGLRIVGRTNSKLEARLGSVEEKVLAALKAFEAANGEEGVVAVRLGRC